MNFIEGLQFLLIGFVLLLVFFYILYFWVYRENYKISKPKEKNALIDFLNSQKRKRKIKK